MSEVISINVADQIDLHIGAKIRDRRKYAAMSQTSIGEAIGVSFQQIQKYERGTNRVSASTLWRIAKTLEVPVGYFFEGIKK